MERRSSQLNLCVKCFCSSHLYCYLSKFNSLGSFHVTYALCSYVNTDQSQSRIDTMSRKLSKLKDEGVQCDYSLSNYQSRGTFQRNDSTSWTCPSLPDYKSTASILRYTTRFLDGWIDFMLLDFVLYDWDRVLSPGGFLWIGSFFCLKDLSDYLESLKMLRYKKHKWVVVPMLDKDDDDGEVFFSAVLEKPGRLFR
ncbi:hypothetical protein TB1_000808 [Malus domestica]